MARLVVKMKHHKDTCFNDIEWYAQNLDKYYKFMSLYNWENYVTVRRDWDPSLDISWNLNLNFKELLLIGGDNFQYGPT